MNSKPLITMARLGLILSTALLVVTLILSTALLVVTHRGSPMAPHSTVQAVTFGDMGGFTYDYAAFLAAADAEGTLVEVYGHCGSACVMKLSARRFCMGPWATFSTHEVRSTPAAVGYDYARGERNETATQTLRAALPACARALFDARDGFASGTPVDFSGEELRAACPQLRLCDAEVTRWRDVERLWHQHAEWDRMIHLEFR